MSLKINSEKLEYDYFDIDHIEERQNLFIECFPSTKHSIISKNEFYEWKFHSSLDTLSYEFVLLYKKKIISYYAAISRSYSVNNLKFTAGMVCDVMTSYKYRRNGLFVKIGDYALDQLKKSKIDVTLGNPLKRYITSAHKKSGWDKIFSMPLYVRILKSNSFLSKIRLEFFSFIFNFFINILNFIVNLPSNFYNQKVCEYNIQQFISKKNVEEFFSDKRLRNIIQLNKSIEFFKWRLSRPDKNYKILTLETNENIIAYAVICVSEISQLPVITIIDLLCLENKFTNCSILMKKIYFEAKIKKCSGIAIMMNKSTASRYHLNLLGFFKSPFKYDLILNNLSNNLKKEIFMNEKKWHLTWLDFDDH